MWAMHGSYHRQRGLRLLPALVHFFTMLFRILINLFVGWGRNKHGRMIRTVAIPLRHCHYSHLAYYVTLTIWLTYVDIGMSSFLSIFNLLFLCMFFNAILFWVWHDESVGFSGSALHALTIGPPSPTCVRFAKVNFCWSLVFLWVTLNHGTIAYSFFLSMLHYIILHFLLTLHLNILFKIFG